MTTSEELATIAGAHGMDHALAIAASTIADLNDLVRRQQTTIAALINTNPPHNTGGITIGGNVSPVQITVDTTSEVAALSFIDDRGNPTSQPTGAVIHWASDRPGIVTIGPDNINPLQATLHPVAVGSATVSVTITGADDKPVPKPDGTGDFEVAPATVDVVAGAADGVALSFAGETGSSTSPANSTVTPSTSPANSTGGETGSSTTWGPSVAGPA